MKAPLIWFLVVAMPIAVWLVIRTAKRQ